MEQKRTVSIKRESRLAYAARKIRILVNGKESGFVENGEVLRLKIPYEKTVISFAIGQKIMENLSLKETDGGEVNIVCYINNKGEIDAKTSYIDFSTNETKNTIPLILRIIIAIPVIVIMYYALQSSLDAFLK